MVEIPFFTGASTSTIAPWTGLLITIHFSVSIGGNRRKVIRHSAQRRGRTLPPPTSQGLKGSVDKHVDKLCGHQQGGFNQQILDYTDYVSNICTTKWSFQLARNQSWQNPLRSHYRPCPCITSILFHADCYFRSWIKRTKSSMLVWSRLN